MFVDPIHSRLENGRIIVQIQLSKGYSPYKGKHNRNRCSRGNQTQGKTGR